MHVKIMSDPKITPEEIDYIIADEKQCYAAQKKVLAEIELTLHRDEIIVKSYEANPIRRVRRITGYLSEEHNFNAAKQAELHNRVNHACASI